MLALVCTECNKATIFSSSPFSESMPANFSINKHILREIGPTAYFKLVRFLQRTETEGYHKRTKGMSSQMVMAMDKQPIQSSTPQKTEILFPKVCPDALAL